MSFHQCLFFAKDVFLTSVLFYLLLNNPLFDSVDFPLCST